jgi:ribonuclease E
MSSSKSPEALETLEADLRSRLDEEVRTLEAYRGRLEREARVDAELARIDAVIARRIGSIPPPAAPSYHPASYHPASYHPASFHSAPVPAMPSWNPPSSLLPPASIAPAPTSQPLPYAYQTSRMVTLSTISAMLAVIVSLTVLIITAGDRIIPTANAAERPTMSAPVNAASGGSCSDKSDKSEPAKKADEAKTTTAPAKSEPAPAAVAKTVAPASKSSARRPATKSASPSKPEAPAAAVEAAPAAAPAPAPAPTNMDDAARTAQMLREQLGASLK